MAGFIPRMVKIRESGKELFCQTSLAMLSADKRCRASCITPFLPSGNDQFKTFLRGGRRGPQAGGRLVQYQRAAVHDQRSQNQARRVCGQQAPALVGTPSHRSHLPCCFQVRCERLASQAARSAGRRLVGGFSRYDRPKTPKAVFRSKKSWPPPACNGGRSDRVTRSLATPQRPTPATLAL